MSNKEANDLVTMLANMLVASGAETPETLQAQMDELLDGRVKLVRADELQAKLAKQLPDSPALLHRAAIAMAGLLMVADERCEIVGLYSELGVILSELLQMTDKQFAEAISMAHAIIQEATGGSNFDGSLSMKV
jgi:hypothetical protein